ncbi:cupin domain-containing protein [Microbacterium tumbae]
MFPGGVAVTDLAVYDGMAVDGCRGGSPHMHTASSEGYVVVEGAGAVETLSSAGFERHPLAPGDVLWFTPGTVHRLVNDGGLRLIAVMANTGLPEAGDAVLTFPAEILDDPERYAAAAALPEGDGREAAVRARRDLAVEGFLLLRDGGAEALAAFQARAVRLVQPLAAGWRERWERTVAAEAERTRDQLAALSAGTAGSLGAAEVVRAAPSGAERSFGMCGMLRTWEWSE